MKISVPPQQANPKSMVCQKGDLTLDSWNYPEEEKKVSYWIIIIIIIIITTTTTTTTTITKIKYIII